MRPSSWLRSSTTAADTRSRSSKIAATTRAGMSARIGGVTVSIASPTGVSGSRSSSALIGSTPR